MISTSLQSPLTPGYRRTLPNHRFDLAPSHTFIPFVRVNRTRQTRHVQAVSAGSRTSIDRHHSQRPTRTSWGPTGVRRKRDECARCRKVLLYRRAHQRHLEGVPKDHAQWSERHLELPEWWMACICPRLQKGPLPCCSCFCGMRSQSSCRNTLRNCVKGQQ